MNAISLLLTSILGLGLFLLPGGSILVLGVWVLARRRRARAETAKAILADLGTVRYRVDTVAGYCSFGAQDYDKALALYHDCGLRLLKCQDLSDEGVVLEGMPLGTGVITWDKN